MKCPVCQEALIIPTGCTACGWSSKPATPSVSPEPMTVPTDGMPALTPSVPPAAMDGRAAILPPPMPTAPRMPTPSAAPPPRPSQAAGRTLEYKVPGRPSWRVKERNINDSRRSATPPPRASEPPKVPKRPSVDPYARRAEELVRAAKEELAAGRSTSAISKLKLALSFEPNNGAIKGLLGKAMLDAPATKSRQRSAAPEGRASAKSTPPRATKLVEEAIALEKTGALEEAVEKLRAANQIEEDPRVLDRIGVILALKLNRFGDGRRALKRAAQLAPNDESIQSNLEKLQLLEASSGTRKSKAPSRKSGFWSRLKRS